MKKILLILLLLGLIGGAYGLYEYNRGHQDLATTAADISLPAETLYTAFETDENKANAQYLDKIIQVKGVVKEIRNTDSQFTLQLDANNPMGGVTAELSAAANSQASSLQTGQTVTVKGVCTGMLLDVVLVRCVIIP